jgi:hypothetical protein
MRVLFHPEFPKDIRKFARDYQAISEGLSVRFRREIDEALEAIKASPQSAGHFLQTGPKLVKAFRRRNLQAFPFFILYGITEDSVVVGSLIPSRTDPLTWLIRFDG